MNNKYLLVLLFSIIGMNGFAQAPGCPDVQAYPGIPLCKPGDCTTISADFFETGETTSYAVTSIPFSPPYSYTGGTALSVGTDDVWSTTITLPFDFCFYGNTFNKILIGSNGVITFSVQGEIPGGLYTPGGGCAWAFTAQIPTTTDPPMRNSIFGVYQDTDPTNGGEPSINYQILGSYPCRTLVFNVSELGQFSCGDANGTNTSQMVLYETTNVIEVYVQKRNPCLSWNSGSGLIGVQNATGTQAVAPPGRNTGTWTATNEAWRFTPNGPSNVEFAWLLGDAVISNELAMDICLDVTTTYTAQATYTLCNGDEVVEQSDITVVVPPPLPIGLQEDIILCGDEPSYTINLNDYKDFILNLTDADPDNDLDEDIYSVGFHNTYESAFEGFPPMNNNASSNFVVNAGEEKTVYVRVEDFFTGCFRVDEFTISTGLAPDSNPPADMQVCDEDDNGTETFDLTVNDGTVLAGQDPNDYTIHYYTSLTDANEGNDNYIANPEAYVSGDQAIFVRISSNDNPDCYGTTTFDLVVNEVPDVEAPEDAEVCSADGYELPVLAEGNYYTLSGGPGVAGQQSYDAGDTISTSQTIYVYHATGTAPNTCTDEDSFTVTVYQTPVVSTPANVAACDSYALPALAVGAYYNAPGGVDPITDTTLTETKDVYIYAATGNGDDVICSDEHAFTVTINYAPVLSDVITPIEVCDDNNDNFANFDLTPAGVEALDGQTGITITYHETEDDALFGENAIDNPDDFDTSLPSIWISGITTGTTTNCRSVVEVPLIIHARPVIPNIADYELCDDNNSPDGIEDFDLTTIDDAASNGNASLEVTYYTNEDDAEDGTSPIANPSVFTIDAPAAGEVPNVQEIFVRVEDGFGCYSVSSFNIVVNPLPVINTAMEPFLRCEEVDPGQAYFDFDAIDPVVTNSASGLTVAYYETLNQAQIGSNDDYLVSPYLSATATIYARVTVAATGCVVITPVQLEVIPSPVADAPDPLEECDFNNDGYAFFNLDPVLQQIAAEMGNVTVTVYETYDDAFYAAPNNEIPNTGAYENIEQHNQIVYIRVQADTGQNGCFDIVELQLIVNPVPEAVTPEPYEICDNGASDTDGIAIFDLTTLEGEILDGMSPADYTVTFHPSADEAANNQAIIPTPASYSSETNTIYARVTNNDTGCYDVVEVSLIVNELPVAADPTPLTLCDEDPSDPEVEVFDLTTKIPEIIGDQEGLIVTFHFTYDEAVAKENAIADPYNYPNDPNVETLFVNVQNAETGCYRIVLLDVRVAPLPIILEPTQDELTVCDTNGQGYGEFNLEALMESMINNGPDLEIAFYETAENALNGVDPMEIIATYQNVVPFQQPIYVMVTNTETGCSNSTPYELMLIVETAPQAPDLEDITMCDDTDNNNEDGQVFFDLTVQNQVIYDALDMTEDELTIHYFTNEDWAYAGAPRITVPDHFNGVNDQTIWVRVEDVASECFSVTSFTLWVNQPLVLETPTPLTLCNTALPNDASEVFDLTSKDEEILGELGIGQGMIVEYFESQAAVDANTPIANPEAYTNTVNPKTIFVRVTTEEGCRSYTTLTIRVLPLPVPDTTPDPLVLCDVNNTGDGVEVFNLTDAEDDIRNNDFQSVVTYYDNIEDAEAGFGPGQITNPEAYSSGNATIYVRVEANTTNPNDPKCYQIVELELIVTPLPTADDLLYAQCEQGTDGFMEFSLEAFVENLLGPGAGDYDITFYENQAAYNAGTALPVVYTNEVAFNQEILVHIENLVTDCEALLPMQLIVEEAAFAYPVSADNNPLVECDYDGTNDGFHEFDLTVVAADVLGAQDPDDYTVTYYETEEDAIAGEDEITNPATYTNETALTQTIWVRVTHTNSISQCWEVTSFQIEVELLAEPVINTEGGNNTICVDFNTQEVVRTLILDSGVTPNGHTFDWYLNGELIASDGAGTYEATAPGLYTVQVTSANGCVSELSAAFEVIQSGPASPIGTGYYVTDAFSDEQTITVLVEGYGQYEFRLDEDGPWQTSNVFVNVAPGSHTVYVRDVLTEFGCSDLVLAGVSVIDFPKFFTPNGDGYHDTWNIIGLEGQPEAKIYIFDRYGKLMKQISSAGEGWDGTFNGQPAVSTDYWFTVTYSEYVGDVIVNKEFKAHFSLKR